MSDIDMFEFLVVVVWNYSGVFMVLVSGSVAICLGNKDFFFFRSPLSQTVKLEYYGPNAFGVIVLEYFCSSAW